MIERAGVGVWGGGGESLRNRADVSVASCGTSGRRGYALQTIVCVSVSICL